MRPWLAPRLVIAFVLLAFGCTTTKVTDRQEYEGGQLPRPEQILVYDFAATPDDLPSWSQERQAYAQAGADMEPGTLDAGRKLGADIATELAKKIDAMGLDGVRAGEGTDAALNDIAIVGYFASIEKGSAVERVVIGFGKGASEVKVHAAGYESTDAGMQLLGSGDVQDGGAGKGPGLVVPALVTIATANPIGLVVGGAVKAEGEISGRTTDTGNAERIAEEIAKLLKQKFQEQGWISG